MKKFYFMALASLGLVMNANAQFTDDIESYDEGPVFNDIWTTWDANDDGLQNAIVTTAYASSGTKSILIGEGGAMGGPQDAVLNLGGVAAGSGAWSVSWMMYIPEGKSAYFNLQGNIDPSANNNLEFLSGNVTFNAANGNPGVATDDNAEGPSSVTFPHGEWFPVTATVNFDHNIYNFTVNGTSTPGAPIGAGITVWGGVDFFAADTANEYYIDDVEFAADPLSVDNLGDATLSVYPNPLEDVLTVETSLSGSVITIYDMVGKVVSETVSDVKNTQIDTSGLTSGSYYVAVTLGDVTKTIKVIK